MKVSPPSALPLARREKLLVVPLSDEVLVQDLATHQAHCLNLLAASVWQHCDGKTLIRDISERLTQEYSMLVDEKMVWFALHQLGKAGLLQRRLVRPADQYLSRRDFMRATGALAATALITSVHVAGAAVGSCFSFGTPCTDGTQCCSNICAAGKCDCLMDGSATPCSGNAECCNGNCTNNKCCHISGPCTTNAECCFGNCVNVGGNFVCSA